MEDIKLNESKLVINSITSERKKRKGFKEIAESRLGETRLNNMGSKMWIIDYVNSNNVQVQFEDGYITTCQYANFKEGRVKSVYDRTVYGIGYLGEGKYKPGYKNKIGTPQYIAWEHMLERCYSEKYHARKPTYKDCTVCDEWHNFQNFAKWYDENYYVIDGETMCLDKDILHKGNKIYSPENCIYVPNYINVLFAQIERKSYKDLSTYKEQLIKEIANKYKEKIPKQLYDAMYRYQA